mgnify:CR=1 FL=1
MAEPHRTMTPEQIEGALGRMVPDALDLLSEALRRRGPAPSRAILDAAFKVIERGLSAEPPSQTAAPDVAELANVLELVTGG